MLKVFVFLLIFVLVLIQVKKNKKEMKNYAQFSRIMHTKIYIKIASEWVFLVIWSAVRNNKRICFSHRTQICVRIEITGIRIYDGDITLN